MQIYTPWSKQLTKRKKLKKKNLRIMSKQYAHLHTMAKTSVKFQNDWPKTEGGVNKAEKVEKKNLRIMSKQ